MASPLKQRQSTHNRLLALKHPMRLRIWRVLVERPASVGDLTAELGLERDDMANVRYHTQYLVRLGCAEQIERRIERGHAIPVYKAMEKALVETEEWDQLREENPEIADHVLGELGQMRVDAYMAALKAETLGEDGVWHVSCTPAVLDQQGLEDGVRLFDEVVSRFAELVRESAERRRESGKDAIYVQSDLALFRVPPPA